MDEHNRLAKYRKSSNQLRIPRSFQMSIVCCLLLAATPLARAIAAPLAQLWKKVGHWDIRVDSSLNNGCFMLASFEGGDIFRVGFNRQNSNGYLIFGNAAWKSLVIDKTYPLEFQFTNQTPWFGDARAFDMSGTTMLEMSFSKSAMLQELAAAPGVMVKYNGTVISNLVLTGSRAAVDELIQCQTAADKIVKKPSDPFSSTAQTTATDPFSR